jgi:hypothetical protein
VRAIAGDTSGFDFRQALTRAYISELRAFLGSDVRLKSRDANVKLVGEVALSGEMKDPYVEGEIYADRGTYRVDLGWLKRTFRVDSGTVRLAGTIREYPALLDIWTSYLVRRPEIDDITIVAHLTGTADSPRLELVSSDLGSSVAQSEIISYLIFGSSSLALDANRQSTVQTATAALVPSLGGALEGWLGSILPFFSSLQVTTVASNEAGTSLTTSPLDALFNSFAIVGGRQLGADGWMNLAGGVCRGSRLASTQSPPAWGSIALEYRPKAKLSAVTSFAPGGSPCSSIGRYQVGLDLSREWQFGKTTPPAPPPVSAPASKPRIPPAPR